ncbi:uncharacterized protein LODBEIA_P16760 [Lodderomyces beijingensis]|uniref:Bud site selection protein 5 n=1 Tax=Lodderomyces beijingensis TaxID=1775926 RepID=A0ABP0ZH07_9ASCO
MVQHPIYNAPENSKHISTSSSVYSHHPGKHLSTSSSVYSAAEPEEYQPNTAAILEEEEEEEEVEEASEYGNHNYSRPTSGFSYVEGEHLSRKIANEESVQTFQSFRTAHTRNEDEIRYQQHEREHERERDQSYSSFQNSSLPEVDHQIDNDETPLLNESDTFTERNMDKTPLIDNNGYVVETAATAEEPTTFLPQRELSKKFKRLSMRLQNANASENSHQFMSSFQQNVEKANIAASTSQEFGVTRRSTYYQKIERPSSELSHGENTPTRAQQGEDQDQDQDPSHLLRSDQHSEVSSVSSCASSIHTDISSVQEHGDLKNSSSSFFVFSSSYPSSYNIKGSQAPNEVPARRDLLETPTEEEKFKVYNNGTENISQLGGLNIIYDEANNIGVDQQKGTIKKKEETQTESQTDAASLLDEEDMSSLFIRALHSFDSSTLQSESDASICLSFQKNDLGFVHTIDESGWGEVTLVESLERGWIPMNYFAIAVSDEKWNEDEENDDNDDDDAAEMERSNLPNSHYLKPLFQSCGKFLLNPLSHKNRKGKFTFSIKVVNAIRDGVRMLLQQTDCLSRSNEIVTKRQIVRKSRKSLLADWYNLMLKANEFKGTSNFNKIEILTLMVYQVAGKAISFLEIWSVESKKIVKRDNERKLHDDLNNYPLLQSPPLAKQRITEINGILFSYLGLVIGRLDLIEHNQVGCEILETLAHQIILLLRELLFISKTGSDFSSKKPDDLDSSLDGLLSLVSDLVTGVKNLVVKTVNEGENNYINNFNSRREYFYTEEGGTLLQVAAKMIRAISSTVVSVKKLLDLTGDFTLNSERSYPDYSRMRIEPQEFVKKCMAGIKGKLANPIPNGNGVGNGNGNGNGNGYDHISGEASKPYKANRYSMVRAGHSGNLGITESGTDFLQHFQDSPFMANSAEFKRFTTTEPSSQGDAAAMNEVAVQQLQKELVIDQNGQLIGGSLKGLVYTLTNEEEPPESFFVSTFLTCFRSFVNGIDLIEELIARFQVHVVDVKNVEYEIMLKKRRRLIVKIFQLWMESYWNQEADYNLLTTLINFFNEGISDILPNEALFLIEIGAKLSTRPLIENKSSRRRSPQKQLVERNIIMRVESETDEISFGNDLAFEMASTDSDASSAKSLDIPLESSSTSNSLLSRRQAETIQKIIMTYRSILGDSWCSLRYLDTYKPLDLNNVLSHFAIICDQGWVLSNYRPNLLDFNGLEIAKQLTMIESKIFCSIQPQELLNQNFTNKRAHLNLSPNVRISLLFTNCLSNYVLESILRPNLEVKERVNALKVWLKIAISSLYLRNFNSLAAIITALQSHLVTRVHFIWANLSQKYVDLYKYLVSIISMEKNYSTYRSKIRNLLNTSATSSSPIPAIVPYVNLFISDITTTTEGIPNHIPSSSSNFLDRKVINFQKFFKIVKTIADLQQLQLPYHTCDESPSALPDIDVEYTVVQNIPALQELILLELWKVNILYKGDEDRGWKLSCEIVQGR